MKNKIVLLLLFIPFCLNAQKVLYSTIPIDYNDYVDYNIDFELNKIIKVSYSMGVNPFGVLYSLNRTQNVNNNKNLNEEHFSLGLDYSFSLNSYNYFLSWGLRYHFYHYIADYAPSFISFTPQGVYHHRSSINIQYLSLYLGNEMYFNKTNLSFGLLVGIRTLNKVTTTCDIEENGEITKFNYAVKNTNIVNRLNISAEIYYGLPNIGLYFQYRITDLYINDYYGNNSATSPFILGIRYSGLSNN